jgi:hypothetical protein
MSSEIRILIEKEVKNLLDRAYKCKSKTIQFLNASSARHHGTGMTHEEAPMAVCFLFLKLQGGLDVEHIGYP